MAPQKENPPFWSGPSQSSDLNPIEKLWTDFKRVIHIRHPKNLVEQKQFCKEEEEWAKIPCEHSAGSTAAGRI